MSNTVEQVTPDAIREQLARILDSPDFPGRSKLGAFLRFVVEQTLDGRAGRIKGGTIALEVLGRDASFDASRDPVVRVQAGRVRQALEHYYVSSGQHDPIRIDMPKGGYVPVFTERAGVATNAGKPTSKPTIAVLPFFDQREDGREDYFAFGLSEELSTQLALIQGLSVIAHYSAMQYRGPSLDLRAVGKELGARYLVTGSVRRSPDRVRLAVQLNEAHTRRQLWGHHYDMALSPGDLLQTQESMARAIVCGVADYYGAIAQSLWKASRRKPVKALTAYEATLRFHHYECHLDPELFDVTLESLQHALEIEPDYALAWAMLGSMYCDMVAFEHGDFRNALAHAVDCARRAVSLDPDCQYSPYAMAYVGLLQGDRGLVVRSAERAIELNPDAAYLRAAAGFYLGGAGELDRGVAHIQASLRLMPVYPHWLHVIPAIRFYRRGEFAQALAEANQVDLPAYPWGPLMRAACLGQLGRKTQARAAFAELLSIRPEFPEDQRLLHHVDLIDGFAEQLLDGLRKAGLEIARHQTGGQTRFANLTNAGQ